MRTIVLCVGRVEPKIAHSILFVCGVLASLKGVALSFGKVRDIAITSSVNGERSLF